MVDPNKEKDKENQNTTGTTETTDPTTTNPGQNSTLSYGDFITQEYDKIHTDTINYYDKLNQDTLNAINDQLKASEEFSKNQHNTAYANAERIRQETDKNADIERERGVVDARSSHEQNLASYGANAEAMGRMGLAGGGYSDYLNSKAYATQRAETQAANVQAAAVKREAKFAEDQAKLDADLSYAKNIFDAQSKARADILAANKEAESGKLGANLTYSENLINQARENESKDETSSETNRSNFTGLLDGANTGAYTAEQIAQLADEYGLSEEQKATLVAAAEKYASLSQEEKDKIAAETNRSNFTGLLDGANSGVYSAEQISQLADEYGLSEEQKAVLVAAAEKYATTSQASANAGIAEAIGDNIGAINAMVEAGTISREEADAHIAKIQKQNADNYASAITNGEADTGAINRAFENGEISETQYNQLKADWNKSIDTTNRAFLGEDGTYLTKDEAYRIVDEIVSTGWLDHTTLENLDHMFRSIYTPSKIGGAYYGDFDGGSAGDVFKVSYRGNTFTVKSGGVIGGQHIIDVASDVGDESLFAFDGEIYMKRGGKIYHVTGDEGLYKTYFKVETKQEA